MSAQLIEYKDRKLLPDDDAIVLFDHISRTGGATISRVFRNHYGVKCDIGTLAYETITYFSSSYDKSTYAGHNVTDLHHLLPSDRKAWYFTLLRNPLSVALSIRRMQVQFLSYLEPEVLRSSYDRYLFEGPVNRLVNRLGYGDACLAEDVLFERYAYFGITEYFNESLDGLCDLLPWLKQETIHNINMSTKEQKNSSRPGKLAQEYFLEKNAKDVNLYEKAVKEFKRRRSAALRNNDDCVIEVKTDENSHAMSVERPDRVKKLLEHICCENAPVLPTNSLHILHMNCQDNFELWKRFYDHLRTSDLPIYKLYSFFCSVRLSDRPAMNPLGNEIFDHIDKMDGNNEVSTLVKTRLDMIEALLANWSAFGAGPFSERCLVWLGKLRSARGWAGKAWNMEARLREADGDREAALDCARRAVESEPDNIHFHTVLCRLLLATDNAAEAETEAGLMLAGNPESEWANCQLALAFVARDNVTGAERMLKKALTKNPYWQKGWVALSQMYRKHGMEEKAFEQLTEAVRLVPDNFDCLSLYCDFLIEKDRLDEAEATIKKSMAAYPHWKHLHKRLSIVHEARGNVDAAVAEARIAIEKSPETMEYREHLADVLIRGGLLDVAEKEALGGMEESPDEAWPYLQIAKVCESRGGEDSRKALGYIRRALQLQPGKRSIKANYAHLLRVCREYSECESFCRKEAAENPEQGWVWRELCRLYMQQGNRGTALEYGAKALSVHPGDAEFRQYYDDSIRDNPDNGRKYS